MESAAARILNDFFAELQTGTMQPSSSRIILVLQASMTVVSITMHEFNHCIHGTMNTTFSIVIIKTIKDELDDLEDEEIEEMGELREIENDSRTSEGNGIVAAASQVLHCC